MEFIYHIADRVAWQNALASGSYQHESLLREGFIHCSTASQVESTANLYFADVEELLVLVIDPGKVHAAVKFEMASRGEEFPHIYGTLNTDSVVTTRTFSRRAGSGFRITPKSLLV